LHSSRLPHFAFRAAVVISLAGLAFYAAIEHAARETICCVYRPLIIIADWLETTSAVIWKLELFALVGLIIVALYALAWIFIGITTGRRTDIKSLFVDCVFGAGATTGLYFAWVVAMGHSEPNWADGFHSTWIALLVISGSALALTWSRSWKMAVRAALWSAGVLISVVVPALLTSVQSVTDQGGIAYEQHAASTKYVFAVLITCVFWTVDVCLSRSPASRMRLEPIGDASGQQAGCD
jgi:hypothetical protein